MNTLGLVFLLVSITALVHGNEDPFKCPSPGGAFPHPERCELYYECIENDATLKKCPDTQYFDLVYSGCNWDYLTDCQDRVTPTPPPGDTTENPGDGFQCPQPGGAFPHPLLCEVYYICTENVPKRHVCPATQLFDLKYSGCNWEQYVDCGDRIRPTNSAPGPGTTSQPGDFDCPASDGLFANPKDCTSYYSCAGFYATLMNCPPGLHFAIENTVCNFPAQVDCGDRPIPSRK